MNTPPRRSLRSCSPYIPGKSVASVQRELGLKTVIKLASNENPLGASPKALAQLRKTPSLVHFYPEGESPELRKAIARFHRCDPASVIVGNGSDELIRLLCEAFVEEEDEVLVSQYGFIRFRQQGLLMGGRIVEVPAEDWTFDLDTAGKTASVRTKLIFIANPNNPTGTYNGEDDVRKLLAAVPPSAIVVLDEAYCHFASEWNDYPRDTPSWLEKHPNLVILRTFSKAYGLAGLRVGYALADPELVGWLDRIRMPFNVNLPAQLACIEALKDVAFVKKSVTMIGEGRETLSGALRAMGFGVQDSVTNFLFARSPIHGREVFKALLKHGVIVRPLDEYGLPNHLRISIGTPSQNKVLLAALKQVLEVLV